MKKKPTALVKTACMAIAAITPFIASAHWITIVSDNSGYNDTYNFAVLSINGSTDYETVYLGNSVEVADHASVEIVHVQIEGGAVSWNGEYAIDQGTLTNVTCDISVTITTGERLPIGNYISSFDLLSADRTSDGVQTVLSGTLSSNFGDAADCITYMELGVQVWAANSATNEFVALEYIDYDSLAASGTNGWTATFDGQVYTHFKADLRSGVFSGFISGGNAVEVDDGIEWDYVVTNGVAVIGRGFYNKPAIPTSTSGVLVVPTELGGYPVGAIESYAFRGCTNLTAITIPSCVTNIGWAAFFGCTALESVSLPGTISHINSALFSQCSSLTELVIPEGVTGVGNNVIQDCTSLKRLVLPTTLRSAVDSAFASAPALEEIVGLENVSDGCYMSYTVFAGDSSLKRIDLSRISISTGVGFLQGCTSLGEVVMPSSGWDIGAAAFAGCSSLTNVVGAWRIGSIGQGAFAGCSSLETFTIYGDGSMPPAEATNGMFRTCASIGTNAFANCTNLVQVSFKGFPIESGEEHGFVADSAFEGCPSATGFYSPTFSSEWNAVIDASGKWHGLSMRMGDPEPISYIVNDGILVGFSGDCPALVEIPDGVTSIGAHVFENCPAIREVVIPDSVTNISEYAFFNSTNIVKMTVGSGVASVGECFVGYWDQESQTDVYGQYMLKDLFIGSPVVFGNLFFDQSQMASITNIVFGNAFGDGIWLGGFSSLESVTLPENLAAIRSWSFGDCVGIRELTIPASVTNIEEYAFYNCTNLTSITFLGGEPNTTYSFDGIAENAVFYVVKGGGVWQTQIPGTWYNWPILYAPASCVIENEEYLILDEDFERGPMAFDLETVGTFPNAPGVKEGMGVDGSRAFSFGRSSCGANVWTGYMNTLTATFRGDFEITRIEFDEMERYGNWGSQGTVLANGMTVDDTVFGRLPSNNRVADTTFRHRVMNVAVSATNLSFHVEDITDDSELYIDNIKVYGRPKSYFVVSVDGSDDADGKTQATAFRTIQRGVDSASSGDTVYVNPGLYAPFVCTNKIVYVIGLGGADATVIDGRHTTRCARFDQRVDWNGEVVAETSVLDGFTLMNGYASDYSQDWYDAFGAGMWGGIAKNCIISSGYGYNCAGAYGSELVDCAIQGNYAQENCGGVGACLISRCIVKDNHAGSSGGGIGDQTKADNCLITGNTCQSGFGAGAAYSELKNCTVVKNTLYYSNDGAGVYCCNAVNCIIWDNYNNNGMNLSNWFRYDDDTNYGQMSHNCTYPLPGEGENISDDPILVRISEDEYRVGRTSPCIEGGLSIWTSDVVDLAGQPRIQGTIVDIGCFEGAASGVLVKTSVAQGYGTITETFAAATGETVSVAATAPNVNRAFDGFYVNGILVPDSQVTHNGREHTLTFETDAADVDVEAKFRIYTFHVSPDGNDASDGLYWATANRTIQSAVRKALPHDFIVVTNGVYESFSMSYSYDITIESVNGPEHTIVDGGGTNRCAYLTYDESHNVKLIGFTLRNGSANYGGGAYGGRLSRCILLNNHATWYGGGTCYSALDNCLVTGNSSDRSGGGVAGTGYEAGVGISGWPSTIRNCTVVNNTAASGGGIEYTYALNSILWDNVATNATSHNGTVNCRYAKVCSDSVIRSDGSFVTNAPQFSCASDNYYSLSAGSPCIDAGDNSYVDSTVDLAGNNRIIGKTVDIGAYEFFADSTLCVVTDVLPAGCEMFSYSAQLEAAGGVKPYTWSVPTRMTAVETDGCTFAEAGTAQGWSSDDGCRRYVLPFTFSFFDKEYREVFVGDNGTITFDRHFGDTSYNYGTITNTPMLAPLWKDLDGGDIYIEPSSEAVTFRWAKHYYDDEENRVNFSATLYADGMVRFAYGDGNANGGCVCYSAGDGERFGIIDPVDTPTNSTSGSACEPGTGASATYSPRNRTSDIILKPMGLPAGLAINEQGVISGIPALAGTNAFIAVVTDAEGLTAEKELSIVVEANENKRPVIDGASPSTNVAFNVETTSGAMFRVTAFDPEGESLSYAWYIDGDAVEDALEGRYRFANGRSAFLWTFAAADGGEHILECRVSDSLWEEAVSRSWAVSIRRPRYVDAANASEDRDGEGWDSAHVSIQDAIDDANDGDTIYVRPGVYAPFYGRDARLNIVATDGPAVTFIDGDGTIRCVEGDDDFRPDHLRIEGFTLRNGYSDDDGGGAYCATLVNCVLWNNKSECEGGAARWCILERCTVVGNTAEDVGGGLSEDCTASECIVWGNTPSDGDDASAPLFVDVINGDLRLREGSPCIVDGVQTMGADLGAAVTGNVVSVRIAGHGDAAPMTSIVETGGNVTLAAMETGRPFVGWMMDMDGHAVVVSTNHTFQLQGITNDVVVTAVFDKYEFVVDAATGDDSNDGLPWGAPKKTIQSAIDEAFDGETIRVADGVYPPIVTANKSIRIESVNGAAATIIDGGGTNRCATLAGQYDSASTNTVLIGFTLRNGYATSFFGPYAGAICGGGSYGGTLERCVISNCVAYSEGGVTQAHGGGSYGGLLKNCLVVGNRAEAEEHSAYGGGVFESRLYNCTVVGNIATGGAEKGAEYGYGYGGGAYHGNTLYNTIVAGNDADYDENSCLTAYPEGAEREPGCWIGGNDPGFVDAENGDYRLSAGSLCIDAGRDGYDLGLIDIDGNPRIVGASVDIGAYEYQGDGGWRVTFDAGEHGSIWSGDEEQIVDNGGDADAPIVAADFGWRFVGWDVPFTNITATTTVTALYETSVALNAPEAVAGVEWSGSLYDMVETNSLTWSAAADYGLSPNGATFAATAGIGLGLTGDDDAGAYELPFAFPFYGATYDKVYPNSNGAIFLDGENTAYAFDEDTFLDSPMIAGMWTDLSYGEVYVDEAADSVTFRWATRYLSYGTTANFSVTLCSNGTIRVAFGDGNADGGFVGVSAGDGERWLVADDSYESLGKAAGCEFTPVGLPDWLTIASDGRLSGTPPAAGDYTFRVMMSDGEENRAIVPVTIHVTERPLPDFAVMNVAVSEGTFMPGDTVTVQYVEANIGTADAVGNWYDRIALEGADGRRMTLAMVSAGGSQASQAASDATSVALPVGGALTNSVTCVIPDLATLAGEVRVVVAADANGDIAEMSESNNEGTSESAWLGKRLYLTVASQSVKENASGGVRFTIKRSGPVDDALTVTLGNTDAASASLPASVTIPAGSVSTIFTMRPIDNAVVDGTRVVSVSASAEGFSGAFVPLTILDDEVPKLTVTLDRTSVREGDGVITATVTREGSTDCDLTVYLAGTSGSRVSYPSSVVIPAGAVSVTFEIFAPNNDTAQVTSELTLRASSSGYTSAAVTYTVEDDDVPGVTLTLSPEVVQEGGVTRAVLTRADTDGIAKAITVRLAASDSLEIASMPSSVTIPARTMSVGFNIYVADDGLDNGDREITIDGAVVIESCGCDGQPSNGDAITATLGIIDNDGPALALKAEPATMKEGLDNAGSLVLSHNSTLTEPLTVSLSFDVEGEIEIPETVMIPAGAASVRIPVKTLDDGVEDGSKIVSVYAEALDDSFAPASTWVLVTDQNMPDLQPQSVETSADTVVSGDSLAVSFEIANKGFLVATGAIGYRIYCVEGTQGVVSDSSAIVGSGTVAGGIEVGGAVSVVKTVTLPSIVGDCRLAVVIDSDGLVAELDEANNTTYSPVVSVSPSYLAEVFVDGERFLQGAEIALSGAAAKAGGATPAAGVEVEIYVIKDGLRRTLAATTDANGRFSAIFKPTSSEAGHYIVGATFPGMGATAEQDSFDILGMKRTDSGHLAWYLTVDNEKTLTTRIANLSSIPLTNVKVELEGMPHECKAEASMPATIAGGSYSTLSVTVRATGVSGGDSYKQFVARVSSAEGVMLEIPLYFYAISAKASLNATPGTLEATVTTGTEQMVEFTLTNVGGADTGKTTVLAPGLGWLRIVSGGEADNLAAGESMSVQLEVSATDALALNYTYTPTIAVNCENGDGIVIPCRITPVSGDTGRIRLSAIEKYSLTAGYTMPVTNAAIQIKNKWTGATIASGSSSADGSWESGEIPAGSWQVYVTAPYHAAYVDEVNVMAERTTEKTVLMDTEAVSAYWKEFRRIDVEDETDIDLVCEYVTTVPQPVVVIKECPDELPQLEEGESTAFNIVAVNEGWIAAQDAHLDLPELEGYEWTAQQDVGLVPAGSSVVVPVVLTRKRTAMVRSARLLAKSAEPKVVCKFVLQIGYFWDCGWDRKWAAFPKLMKFKACFYQTDGENVPKPPSTPDPSPIGPELPNKPGNGRTSPGGGVAPRTVELGDTCNPCVMGRGYALIDVITGFFTHLPSSDLTDEDVRNLKEMGMSDDSELMEILRYFGYGKNLDASKSVGEYTKEMAIDALKGVLKYGKKLNKVMVIVGKENNWTNPRWSPTLAKIGEATKYLSCLSEVFKVLKLTNNTLDAFLNPEHCAHLNLPPLIDSDGNINEDLVGLVEKRYEFAWEETSSASSAALTRSLETENEPQSAEFDALMNSDIPRTLWSGLLKFEMYRLQVAAYGRLMREMFPANTLVGNPSFGQAANFMEIASRHVGSSGLSRIDKAEFADLEWDGEDGFSDEQIDVLVSNWNAGIRAYEGEQANSEGVDIIEILRNYRIIAQTESIARSLGYWSVGHMVEEEKPLLLAAIDEASGSVCASVKLKISQTVRMTREAFEGVLEIGNSSVNSPITDIRLIPIITDDSGAVSTNLFAFSQTGTENMTGGSILQGGVALAAGQTGTATIQFVPGVEAAPEAPRTYRFGGLLSYVNPFTGVSETKEILPVTMMVNPSPRLAFDYFVQRDVIGDDPFTKDVVEPSVPAEVALVIRNNGYGDASNVTVRSAAPQILENTKGLAVDFALSTERTSLNGANSSLGLSDVAIGTIPAQSQTVAQWWLTCNIQGHFRGFDAAFTHRSSFGETVANMSLVESVDVHPLVRSIDADGDSLPDFLVAESRVDGRPDTIFTATGAEIPVVQVTDATCETPDSGMVMRLSVSSGTPGWIYATCEDGADGRCEIVKVLREDGSEVPPRNCWLTDRTFPDEGDPIVENTIHLVDRLASSGGAVYMVYLRANETDPLAVAGFSGIAAGSVLPEMPDDLTVSFTKPVDAATFDISDIELRRQGMKIDDLSALAITPANADGSAFTISGLRSIATSGGTYVLTVQSALVADTTGSTGIFGRSLLWTVSGEGAAVPQVEELAISPDLGFSSGDGVTCGSEFVLSGRVVGDGYSARVVARQTNAGDIELWSGSVVDGVFSATVRLSSGTWTLVVRLTDAAGNSSDTEKSIYVDAIALTGVLSGASEDEDVITTSATLTFSDRVMDGDVTLDKLSLTRDGEAVALDDVTFTKVNDTTFSLSGLDALCAEDGNYVLRFDGSAVRKYASGLPMNGSLVMRWRYENPDREPPMVAEVLFDGETPHEAYTNVFSTVAVTFSEAVNAPELIENGLIGKAARIDLLDAANAVTGSAVVASTMIWNGDSNTLSWQIDPLSVPAGGARLILDAELIADLAGNRLAAEGYAATDGMRTYTLSGTVLARVNSYAMPTWNNGELYVGEKTADNKGKIRRYAANGTWSYLQSDGVDIEMPAQGCQGASVAFADMDGDGVVETYVGTAAGEVLKYPGGETIASLGTQRAVPYVYDMDGDGCDELITGGMDGRIRVISRDADTGTYSVALASDVNGSGLTVPNGRSAPVVADLNHDGLADIVSGDTAGNIWAYFGDGNAWCARPMTVFTNNVSLADRSRLGYGDVDGDGIEDIIVGRSDGSVTVMLGAEASSPVVPFAVKAVVSASAGVHGAIAPVGDTTYDGGDTPEYVITPDVGYHVADVLVDGISIGATNRYVFAPLTTSHTISADFAVTPYSITYAGLKGASNSNPATYTVEDTISFAAPGDVYGWVFTCWTPASIALGTTGEVEVTANWERAKFDVTVNGETQQYDYETAVEFSTNAYVNAGATQYVCKGWVATNAEPSSGDGNRAELCILGNVSLDWFWETNVVTLAQSLDAESLDWTTGGAAEWQPEWSDAAADVQHDARCASIGNNTNAWLAATVEGPGTMAFSWRSALVSRNTKLQLLVDGDVKGMLTGTNGWAETSVTVFGEGTHEIKWRLATGRSGASDGDFAALDLVTWTPSVPPTLAEALCNEFYWTTEGDVLWRGVARESLADARDAWAVVSGLGDDAVSAVETKVYGSGILSFDWAISCEEDYDWMELSVDGKVCDYISGEAGWTSATIEIVGEGCHTVRWEYVKDELDDDALSGENVARLDNVKWTPYSADSQQTSTTPDPVPFAELRTAYSNYWMAAEGDYEAAAKMTGRNGYAVWQSYVAGLEPDNESSKFTAKIEMVDGKPVVTWEPDTPELRAAREYITYGKKTLLDCDWTPVTDADRDQYNFFKVEVKMK